MKPYHTPVFPKLISIILAILMLYSSQAIFSQEPRSTRLAGLFKWAASDYLGGKFREVIRDMKLLLSYFDDEPSKDESNDDEILKGKIYLLLGATYERLGRVQKAQENYRFSKEILEKHQVKMMIDGLDFTFLKEYRRIVQESKSSNRGNLPGSEKQG